MQIIRMNNDFALKTLRVFAEDPTSLGAIDIETTWLPDNIWAEPPELVSVAITFDGVRAFVFKGIDELQPARSVLEGNPFIMHNGLFDRLMLKTFFDLDVTLKHDTMAIQYLLDPDEPKGLEVLSEKFLGLPAYKDVDYKNILDEPFEKVAQMNADDVCRTYNLFRPLADELNKDKALSRIYQWHLMPAVNNLIEITGNGIPMMGERLAEVTARTTQEVDELLTELRAATPLPSEDAYPKGWPKPSTWRVNDKVDKDTGEILIEGQGKYEWPGLFNPGSPKQVAHILFDYFELPILEYTKDKDTGEDTDNPSTNADVLLRLETEYASGDSETWLTNVRTYRKATKLLSYLTSWPLLATEAGYLHPRFKPLHTVTGRLSSEGPNIQQVPRDKEIRSCFGPAPDSGLVWMKADYSQIELRLAALASNEETILQAYHDNADIHRLTASLVLGDDSDEARQVGKTLNFGLLYGAGPATLQRVARSDYGVFLTLDQARYYKDEFFKAYPGLHRWHRECEAEIEVTGVSRSPLGRVRYLPHAKVPRTVKDMWSKKMGAIREGINHKIQSFANDLTLVSMNNLMPLLKPYDAKVIAMVHDEIDLLVPEAHVAEVGALVKATMEDLSWLKRHGIELGVPVVAEVEVGPTWGEVKGLL